MSLCSSSPLIPTITYHWKLVLPNLVDTSARLSLAVRNVCVHRGLSHSSSRATGLQSSVPGMSYKRRPSHCSSLGNWCGSMVRHTLRVDIPWALFSSKDFGLKELHTLRADIHWVHFSSKDFGLKELHPLRVYNHWAHFSSKYFGLKELHPMRVDIHWAHFSSKGFGLKELAFSICLIDRCRDSNKKLMNSGFCLNMW